MHSNGLVYDRVGTPADFMDLRDEWDGLVTSLSDTVFLTHTWLANWLVFLGEDWDVRTVTARDAGRLVAAIPLASRRTAGGVRRTEFMGSGTLTPNHLDVLALPEYRQTATRGFAHLLMEDAGEWDVLDLDKLPEDSSTAAELLTALSAGGARCELDDSAVCPYAELPATYEEFLASRSKTARRHTRERTRCIERENPQARFGMVRDEEELEAALGTLVRLHQQRWEERGYVGSFADPAVVRFHEATTRDLLRDGKLRFFTLTNDGEVMAALLCYRTNHTVQAYSCAFDPTWSSYRPGMVLGAYAIEQSILDGASRYDHLEGDEAHKASWAGHERRNVRLRAFSTSARGRAARLQHRANARAIEIARQVMPAPMRESLLKVAARARSAR